MKNVEVFLSFANLYQCFIQSFSKITRPLTSMLKTSFAIKSSNNPLLSIDVAEINEVGVGNDHNCEEKTVGRSLSKNLNRVTGYLTPDARQIFTQLKQAFTKAPIL